MGQLVFQANAGGQTALVGPNPSTSISINIPATNGNMVTTGDSGTVTNTMLASSAYTAPGTIGSGTPNTGAFTTLSATTLTLGGTQNQQLGAGNASIMKNRLINGAMVIDQRNAGASVTPTDGTYTLDRWLARQSVASKFSVQQNAGSVTPPVGFVNYLGCTSLSAYSVGAGDFYVIQQRIEGFNTSDLGWGTANAKTVTLSFQVYSSLTGTFGGALQNATSNRAYPFTYSIGVANTWTTISVTIAGDTTGTWATNNGIGITVNFGLGVGSTYSGTAGAWNGNFNMSATGATSVVGTNGATFYITGVQLEVGASATGFEYRQYGQELALCQRYYYQGFYYIYSSPLSTSEYKVTMRTGPTITGGGAGFSVAVGVTDRFIGSQTTAATQLMLLSAEL
jgi:hypothetical protein